MLNLRPLNGTLGARIDDVELRDGNGEAVTSVRAALQQYRVLVLPNQGTLGPEDLLAFAEQFGTAERARHPIWDDVPNHIGVKRIATGNYATGVDVGDSWHTDGPPRLKTQWFTFLQAVDVPPFGRDTLFADTVGALQRLSPALREFLETLTALNSWGAANPDAEPVVHPVVMVDPETGVKSLYVNQLYTTRIRELREEESDLLLKYLFRQTSVPELQLRVSWEPGTLVIWDNEKTQHYVVRDKPHNRVMHRVMVNTGR